MTNEGPAGELAGAYLRQARSDFAVFRLLIGQDRSLVHECHPLHYLQMATEKLAKAAMLRLGVEGFDRFSHVAFSQLPYQLRRRDVAATMGWANFDAYRTFLRKSAPLFREIDELNPAVDTQGAAGAPREGPNVEYPWQSRDAAGSLHWTAPANHRFDLADRLRRSGEAATVLHFVHALMERFDEVFR